MDKKADNNVNSGKPAENKFWRVVRSICSWIFKLRSILMAVPVAIAAIFLALQNIGRLPAEVGISLQASGEYSMVISRNLAVLGPLGITAVCLLMMFCSKRVTYPWLISIFTLILPYALWITNTFPT